MQNITSILKNERAKTVVLTAAIVALIQLFAVLALTIAHPYTGEILHNALISVGLFINAALAGICCLMIVAAFAWNVKKGIVIDFDFSGVKQLPAGPAHRLGVDIPVFSHPNESGESFAAWLADEVKNANQTRWVVAIQRGNPMGVIYSAPDTLTKFDRHRPPFEKEVMPDADRCAPEWANFSAESEFEYTEYLRRFSAKWPDYSAAQKLDSVHKAQIGDTFASVARAISVACFVLFSVILPAQTKTEQVVSAFGGTGGVPDMGAEIVYQFQNGDIIRTADGRRNFVELLKSVPGFQDNGGRLIAVWNGTRSVARANDVERVNARPASKSEQMRPASVIVPTEQQLSQLAMPDSSEVDEAIRHEFDYRKTQIWRAVAPYWKIAMWIFWSLLPIPIYIIRVLRYYAKTAKNERFYGLSGIGRFIHRIHESCSGYILLICWGLAGFLFLDLFMVFVYWGISLWGWLFTVFPLSWMAEKLTNWVTPNPPTAMQVEQGSGKSYYPAGR